MCFISHWNPRPNDPLCVYDTVDLTCPYFHREKIASYAMLEVSYIHALLKPFLVMGSVYLAVLFFLALLYAIVTWLAEERLCRVFYIHWAIGIFYISWPRVSCAYSVLIPCCNNAIVMAGVVWLYSMDWPIGYFKFILQTLVVAVVIGNIHRCTEFRK